MRERPDCPADDYAYSSAPIPFRDFPYGTNWRLGRGSTSSNRADDQKSIQLFAQGGEYGDHSATYPNPPSSTTPDSTYAPAPGDLPYEPARTTVPRLRRRPDGDDGTTAPGREPRAGRGRTSRALGLSANPSLGHGPGYRGRLTHPSILVLADQESQDDLFTGRALTGNVGQHLQAFLRSAGVTEQYAIVRTLPVDSLGDPVAAVTTRGRRPGHPVDPARGHAAGPAQGDRHARSARRAGRRSRGAAGYAGGPPRALRRARIRRRRGSRGSTALAALAFPRDVARGRLPRWP